MALSRAAASGPVLTEEPNADVLAAAAGLMLNMMRILASQDKHREVSWIKELGVRIVRFMLNLRQFNNLEYSTSNSDTEHFSKFPIVNF